MCFSGPVPIVFFTVTALLHTMVLILPLFFDFMIVPGYAALFFLISLPLSMMAPGVPGLKRWHLFAFLPMLFLLEELALFSLAQYTGVIPAAVLQMKEFLSGVAPTGIISSLGVYLFASMITIISLTIKEKRSLLYIHRIVDSEDEWNRVYAFLRDHAAAGDISEFRWRQLQNRCYIMVAVTADQIVATALLTSLTPGEIFISDFIFLENEIGQRLLSCLLARPELRRVEEIHFISRPGEPQLCEFMPETWLRQQYSEDYFQSVPIDAMNAIQQFSPDGTASYPFMNARPLFTFSRNACVEGEAKNT
jgi:hypothetical protein